MKPLDDTRQTKTPSLLKLAMQSSRDRAINLHPAVWLIPVAALIAALLPLHYGYYLLLRVVVFFAAAILAFNEYQFMQSVSGWLVGLIAIAVLWNPLLPVHISREAWVVLDIGAALFFVGHARSRSDRFG